MSNDPKKDAAPKAKPAVAEVAPSKRVMLTQAEQSACADIAGMLVSEGYPDASPELVGRCAELMLMGKTYPELPGGTTGRRAEQLVARCRDETDADKKATSLFVPLAARPKVQPQAEGESELA